jgi:hypothetical protein
MEAVMKGKRDEAALANAGFSPTTLPATGDNMPRGSLNEPQNLEETFRALAKTWKAESLVMSSVTDMTQLPSYQQIIALGPGVIPLLLRELEQRPDHWFWALYELTGANPVPEESRGRVREMAQAWVRWGREQGYRW